MCQGFFFFCPNLIMDYSVPFSACMLRIRCTLKPETHYTTKIWSIVHLPTLNMVTEKTWAPYTKRLRITRYQTFNSFQTQQTLQVDTLKKMFDILQMKGMESFIVIHSLMIKYQSMSIIYFVIICKIYQLPSLLYNFYCVVKHVM